ncbi:hypothetical protein [Parendozoicomonas sp. Alg238-R29]|uniref:hypothetical protein n=1 Tax=Parendozoicomonas sp. Alg238-R29 TaxID=2993446 RepID=UPI00248D9FD7|nr:hypothetical protein [Parendozoicomonas sp. Alg238-R29]
MAFSSCSASIKTACRFVALSFFSSLSLAAYDEICGHSDYCLDANQIDNYRLEYGEVVHGHLKPMYSSESSNVVIRFSEYVHKLKSESCSNWQPILPEDSLLNPQELEKKIKNYSLDYQPNVQMAFCYQQESSPDMQYSVNLQDMTQYVNYLHKIRLPLSLTGSTKPEDKHHWVEAQKSRAGCQSRLPAALLNKLDEFQDPVTIFPLFVKLGRGLRALSAVAAPELKLLKPSLSLEHQPVFITDAASRLMHLERQNSRSFMHWNENDLVVQSMIKPLFIPVSFNVPAGVQVSYLNGGDVTLHRGSLMFPDDTLTTQWEMAFELLSFVIHKSLGDTVEKRAPCFLGYIPPEEAIVHARASGFYDLDLLSGMLSHGTASHIIQLARLKQLGLGKDQLKFIDSSCWNSVLESIPVHDWSLAFGVRTKAAYDDDVEDSVVFHGLPVVSAPAGIQHLLTEKLLSRLIRAVDRDASDEEKEYFRENWLRTKGSLKQITADVEALENTILAKQLNSWRLILKHAEEVQLLGSMHGGEQHFDKTMVPRAAKKEAIDRYKAWGYRVENIGDSYILHPPEFSESWESSWQLIHEK